MPILERVSGLKFNRYFFAGYSPERINPGDKEHRLTTIRKVTSGSTPAIAAFVDQLYGSIVTAGTHRASSIRVAEAAKVIENTQRDVNIALINELALIFDRLGIDTEEVLNAAGSKWNFLPFRPGLVGGHCIGVDPYYLTHKAQEIGYHPEMILAGRRLNDNMALHVAGAGPMIDVDEHGRPTWLYSRTVQQGCGRAGFAEQGEFARTPADHRGCLVKLGCKGPVVKCNVPVRGWVNGVGGCPNVGGICMACTMPGFPDKYMPFMDEDKWGGVAADIMKFSYGPIVRFMRNRHIKTNFDVEPEWRKRGKTLTTGYAKRW